MSTEIERLRELEAKATAGTWRDHGDEIYTTGGGRVVAYHNYKDEPGEGREQASADMKTCAASRNALPRFLALYDAASKARAHRQMANNPYASVSARFDAEQLSIRFEKDLDAALSALSSPQ